MENNKSAFVFDPSTGRSVAQKQHDLKIKAKIAFNTQCRRKRHRAWMKKRKLADSVARLNQNTRLRQLKPKPNYASNIHTLFYPKALLNAQLATYYEKRPRFMP